MEEVEHILSDLIFIQDGKIALDRSMEDVHQNFSELMVAPDMAEAARQLNPLTERELFGRHIFLYENADREQLKALGGLRTPSVADLFVATMSRGDT